MAILLGARTLLGAPGHTTRSNFFIFPQGVFKGVDTV